MPLRNQNAAFSASLPAIGLIGKVVRSLCHTNAHGVVVMRFERCAYLQFDEQLVCIGLNEIGASSISALFVNTTRTLPQSFSTGVRAQLSKGHLVLDDRYFFDLAGSTLYVPVLQNNLSRYRTITLRHEFLSKLTLPPAGFAPLLQQVIEATTAPDLAYSAKVINPESELLRFALPAIAQLVNQIRIKFSSSDAHAINSEFDSALFQILIGAGPGLTPSGDDFICGVFTALHLSGFSQMSQSLWASIHAVAKRSTTQVSIAMLEQSALGESGERLETVVQAYLDYPLSAADDFQRLVDLIGETSGWDWLTGFVLCIDILWHKQINIADSLNVNLEKGQAAQI